MISWRIWINQRSSGNGRIIIAEAGSFEARENTNKNTTSFVWMKRKSKAKKEDIMHLGRGRRPYRVERGEHGEVKKIKGPVGET